MADREKVKKALECCIAGDACISDCPYFREVPMTDGRCITALQADTLALLKEQEAIPPGKESDGNPGKWASWWYVCGACGKEIDYRDRFCRYCAQEVKWE